VTSAAHWLEGARPRTLPAALAPVLVGSGAAALEGSFRPGRALLALVVALALQVGVNYANDYSDGVRGTDADRVGPCGWSARARRLPAPSRPRRWPASRSPRWPAWCWPC
jgi:1,4-dihydroxy-2-naphthoate octaprenyltransferase